MLLYLDSRDATNNRFKLDDKIKGIWKLISFTSTNNIYNVTDNNNKIYINENGSDLTATLTNGYYDSNDLKTNLSTALNNVCTGTVVVTFDENTNKFTITDTLNYYFTFGTNTTNSARKLIGFNQSDGTNGTSQTSDIAIDVCPHKNVFINIKENDDRNVIGTSYFNSSLIINGCQQFGETMRYENNNEYFSQYVKFRNTKTIELEFHDINNNSIDLNSDYSMILKKQG